MNFGSKWEMMRSCILLSIGDELLQGFTVDTNLAWLAKRLHECGWVVKAHYTIADNIDDIVKGFQTAAANAPLVISTGGLGPTPDDLTREGIARVLQQPLEERSELIEQIQNRFKRIGREMTAINRIQAQIPSGTTPIPNIHGTAPGIWAKVNDADVFILPGVPREMKALFNEFVVSKIEEQASDKISRIHIHGVGESVIGAWIQEHANLFPEINFGTNVHSGCVTIRLMSSQLDKIEKADGLFRNSFHDDIFGVDDTSLSEAVVQALAKQNKTLAAAESCTGGLLSSMIVENAGASDVFLQGFITYSNESKERSVGVDKKLIQQHGAVSKEVAKAMAKGCLKQSGTDYAIAITGVAGPGGTEGKPEGTTWIALASSQKIVSLKQTFASGRNGNRMRAAMTALDMLRRECMSLKPLWGTEHE